MGSHPHGVEEKRPCQREKMFNVLCRKGSHLQPRFANDRTEVWYDMITLHTGRRNRVNFASLSLSLFCHASSKFAAWMRNIFADSMRTDQFAAWMRRRSLLASIFRIWHFLLGFQKGSLKGRRSPIQKAVLKGEMRKF